MRIILTGTKDKLVKPSEKDLALPNWDNSYLEWVDLSGLKLPLMRDADCFHYKATSTVFANTDYTQFRYPIDLTDAEFPEDLSSYSYDFLIEILRRGSVELTGLSQYAAKVCYDYTMVGQLAYVRSWRDTYYRLLTELELGLWEAFEVIKLTFRKYPKLLSRLAWHRDQRSVRADPPDIESTSIYVEGRTLELAPYLNFGRDRYALKQMLDQIVAQEISGQVDFHIVQSVPYFVILQERWPA